MKNNMIKKTVYILICAILYMILPVIFLTFDITNNQDDMMPLTFGISATSTFFITSYIRNFLQYLLKTRLDENDSSKGVNFLNLIYTILSSSILYLVLKNKDITEEISAIMVTLYFIVTYVVMLIESKRNKKSDFFNIIKHKKENKEKVAKYIFLPMLFLGIWALTIIGTIIYFSKTESSEKISVGFGGLLFAEELFMVILGYIYSKIICKLANKNLDLYSWPSSRTYRLYYESFLYNVPLLSYIVYALQLQYISKYAEGFSNNYVLGFSFIMVIIPYYILKFIISDMWTGVGDNSSSNNSNNKQNDNKKSNFSIKTGDITDEFGNVIERTTTTTIDNDYISTETTEIKDLYGNTKAKIKETKW